MREALAFLVTREIARRDERRISMAGIAQFPFVRELDGFDFDAQPSLDQRQIGSWRPAAGLPMETRSCSLDSGYGQDTSGGGSRARGDPAEL